MKNPRFCPAVTLLKDKYIIAAGGQIDIKKKTYTTNVELYDI
jgi:hypothetical protein